MIAIPTLASGGAERVASIWANGLAEYGRYDTVFVFTLFQVDNEYPLNDKVKRVSLSENEANYRRMGSWEKILTIRKILKTENIRIVIPMVTYIGLMFNFARIGTDTKIIETIRNNPNVVPNSKIMRIARDFSVATATGCIFQNTAQKAYFRDNKKYIVIPNPVSDEFINSARVYKSIPNNIVALGRLHKQKNYRLLINTIGSLAYDYDIRLDIYGDGPQLEELQDLINIKELNQKIHIHRRTSEVLDKLINSDIYVLSSDYEGMPNVLMEAMATGIPCIATNCPTGPSDLIEDNINGLLVKCNDENDLRKALELYLNDYDCAIKHGKNAKKYMMNYKTEKIITVLDEYISSFL